MAQAKQFDLKSTTELSSELPLSKDLVFAQQPENPDMRESVNIWMFSDDGAFAFPRMALEAIAETWDNRMFDANFAFPGGRVLKSFGWGDVPSPIDEHGLPTIFGGGPLRFHCLEPFKRWQVTFDGDIADGHVSEQIDRSFGQQGKTVPFKMDAELTMVTPAWVQDRSPEKVAKMSQLDRNNAEFMGVGYRFEMLFNSVGNITFDGKTQPFSGTGTFVHRQSMRPESTYKRDWLGHCWQSAKFADGRAFGCCAYPNKNFDSYTYNDAYIFENNTMYPAKMVKTPWLKKLTETGQDCSLELEYEKGRVVIGGESTLSTYTLMDQGPLAGFGLNQSGAWYSWDGQKAIGMMERSSPLNLLTKA